MVVQHAKRTERYFIDIGGLSGCTKFFYVISKNGTDFEKENYWI